MLSGRLPTGTVGEGRADDRSAPEASEADPPTEASPQWADRRIAALEAEVAALEQELARREAERREIIDRYESLLRARERDGLTDRDDGEPASLRARLRRLFGRRTA